MTASALTRPGERDRLIVKIGQIDWVFCFLVCAIAGIGGMMLYSIANASWEPWAAKHVIRFGFCLIALLVLGPGGLGLSRLRRGPAAADGRAGGGRGVAGRAALAEPARRAHPAVRDHEDRP